MKKDLLIDNGAHGKRLRMVEPAQTKELVEAGDAFHVRGNVYATKVMRADVRTELQTAVSEVFESFPKDKPERVNNARKEPSKKPRGRPRKGS